MTLFYLTTGICIGLLVIAVGLVGTLAIGDLFHFSLWSNIQLAIAGIVIIAGIIAMSMYTIINR